MTLAGGRVVAADETWEQGWVRVAGGRIAEVGAGPAPTPAVDCRGRWIVPGFIDIHCHGGGGGSFTDSGLDGARTAIATHRGHGSTTMLASLVSAPLPLLAEQLGHLRELVQEGVIAGVHLE
jgi:N-acetylglucosamine-6-phosphate deacetylase